MSRLVDAIHCMRLYRHKFRRFPNLIRPQSFNEKMQVAKLTWRSPLLPILVDKVRAKAFIAEHFGADLVTPNLFVDETLPPREQRDWPLPFVIKVNHGSKFNLFVRTAADRDWDAIEATVNDWLARDYGRRMGEWAYSQVPRRVLVEPLLGDPATTPKEFKFTTLGGRVVLISATADRYGAKRTAQFDRDWQPQPMHFVPPGEPLATDKPAQFERLLAIAEAFGQRLPQVRLDFFEVDGAPRFSEVTIYSGSGLQVIVPHAYDLRLGALWPKGKPKDVW